MPGVALCSAGTAELRCAQTHTDVIREVTVNEQPSRPTVPLGNKISAGILIVVAIVVPLIVWNYASATPRLWGFPFFFWYQLLWVFIASGLTWCAYLLIERGRR
jgi:hypothetical protein